MKFIYYSRGESVKNLNYDFIHIDELAVPCQSNAKREKSFPTFFLTDISIFEGSLFIEFALPSAICTWHLSKK